MRFTYALVPPIGSPTLLFVSRRYPPRSSRPFLFFPTAVLNLMTLRPVYRRTIGEAGTKL